MKKIIFAGVLCFVVLFFNVGANADDFYLDIGVKGWVNQWKIKFDAPDVEDTTSDTNLLIGPMIKVGYKKFFGGVTFMQAVNDYDFGEGYKWSRKDVDIVFGYMLHSRVAIFAGYKYLTGTSSIDTSHTASGPAFGISLNFPITKIRTTIYANGVYMPLKGELNSLGIVTDHDVNSYSLEGGISVSLHKNWLVNVGYKYQYLDWRKTVEDITSGVTFGISYVTD